MDSKKIKWGILGPGWIATKFANALKVVDDAELYAVASSKIENAKKFAQEFNAPKAYGSYEELVKDPDVDVVYVATTHNFHYANTMLCLENGKHVLCEKPFAINGKEVRAMIAKAKEKNLFLMEALWSRFLPHVIKAKEIIDSGEIGKVKLFTSCFSVKSDYGLEHRQFNKDLCGGALLDIGIYNVFLSLFLLGKPQSFKSMATIGVTDVDFAESSIFKYADEKLAVLYSSFIAQSNVVAEVHCETGKIVFEHMWFRPGNLKIERPNNEITPLIIPFKGNGYNYEAEEAGKCIREGKLQSDKFSWENSLELIDMLDSIRKEIGVSYPKHDF
jgi:scyllo-inositol 2-dehydrogenase (NADP+)